MQPSHSGIGAHTEEMCGEEAAAGGEMCLAEGVKRRGSRMVGARRAAPPCVESRSGEGGVLSRVVTVKIMTRGEENLRVLPPLFPARPR